jgi:hypothetical protein
MNNSLQHTVCASVLLAFFLDPRTNVVVYHHSQPLSVRRRRLSGVAHFACTSTTRSGEGDMIAQFFDRWILLVDRGLRHRLPGFSSLGRLVVLRRILLYLVDRRQKAI